MTTTTRRELPRITHKQVRVQLLAGSYLEAVDASPGTSRNYHGHEHRMNLRNSELWAHGSYKPFERAVDELRRNKPTIAFDFWQTYIRKTQLAGKHRQQRARYGLTLITIWMPATVHVPAVVTLAAGYPLADARAYDRKPDNDQLDLEAIVA